MHCWADADSYFLIMADTPKGSMAVAVGIVRHLQFAFDGPGKTVPLRRLFYREYDRNTPPITTQPTYSTRMDIRSRSPVEARDKGSRSGRAVACPDVTG
jgi:hypothetical protein